MTCVNRGVSHLDRLPAYLFCDVQRSVLWLHSMDIRVAPLHPNKDPHNIHNQPRANRENPRRAVVST